MTFSEERPVQGHRGPSVLGDTPQTPLLRATHQDATWPPCLHRGRCTQRLPQRLPGTVIWMMSSSSGSILICLIPPSSPEVPTRERQRKAIANRNQQYRVCPPMLFGQVAQQHQARAMEVPKGCPAGMAFANSLAGRRCWCP